jgi:hypothetical protein
MIFSFITVGELQVIYQPLSRRKQIRAGEYAVGRKIRLECHSVLLQCIAAFRLRGRGSRASWNCISVCRVNANGTYCQSWNVFLCLNCISINKTGNAHKTWHSGAFALPFLQWESNKYYIFWVCVFAGLVIQYAMCVLHIVICGLSTSTVFSTLSYKRYDFRRKKVYKIQRIWQSIGIQWTIR